jgi:hypothetical protein
MATLRRVTERRRHASSTAVGALLLALMLSACAAAGPPDSAADAPTPQPVSTRVPSNECGEGGVYEWDGSPGPATRAGAIQDMLEWYEKALASEPMQPSHTDRESARIAIRTLRAGLEALPDAEATVDADDYLVVEPIADDGASLGSIHIDPQRSGGYRVGMFGAVGFDTDGPECIPAPVISARCSVEETYPPGALPSAATREGAIRVLIDMFETSAGDPLQAATAARGLAALLEMLPRVVNPPGDDEPVGFSAFHDNGYEHARIDLAPHPDGGLQAEAFRATAFTTDPQCGA